MQPAPRIRDRARDLDENVGHIGVKNAVDNTVHQVKMVFEAIFEPRSHRKLRRIAGRSAAGYVKAM